MKRKIYVSFFRLSGIGIVKVTFEILNFFLSKNFNFTCILWGKGTRSLWKDGEQIVCDHFIHPINDEVNSGLKLIPKLTLEHIHLTPYSVMNVSFAIQVLSSTVANVLRNYHGEETWHCKDLWIYGQFFGCLNVRNQIEGVKKRKSFLKPYTNLNDERFKQLKNDFLQDLLNWKMSIFVRTGKFSQTGKDKMFLSWQTHDEIQITVHSIIEAAKYLLGIEMPFVLTEHFNQDSLEEYFGKHRSIGRRNDNQDLYHFGYNSNTICM